MMAWMTDRGASVAAAQNAVLLLVVLFQNAYVLCMRSERRPLWREPLGSNPWLLLGVSLALGLHVLAMQWAPLQAVLGTSPVDPVILAICLAGAVMTVVVTEATKWIVQRR
jgi:magnesium-transporting ATPase (P-type)